MKAKLLRSEVMVVDKSAVKRRHLVYLLIANRPEKYPWGRSSIMYIGTTAKGVARIAKSAGYRAKQIFGRYGVKKFSIRVVTFPRRPGIAIWKELEKDILKRFKIIYGEVPKLNAWKKIRPRPLSGYFGEANLDRIIQRSQRN